MTMLRKSLQEHFVQGTKPEYAADKPSAFRAGRPKMPADLPGAAQAEWKKMVKQLSKRGTLTTSDASALEVYVRMFAQWLGYCAHVEEHGPMIPEPVKDKNGDVHIRHVQNPAAKLALQLGNALRQYQKEFSATPASRERAKPAQAPPPPPAAKPAPDSFEERYWAEIDARSKARQNQTGALEDFEIPEIES